ncbi:MAG: LVIVD repeat-containing protein [Tepidanaerobacteraceae bacterium]
MEYSSKIHKIGYHDLNDKPGFKLALSVKNDRWFLYVAHLWEPGWSILDVTNPKKPELVKFISGPKNTWTLQIQVANNLMITSLEKIPKGWGRQENEEFQEGILIWDVSNPEEPRLLSHFKTGGTGTHRNFYNGGNYVYLAAGFPGFEGNVFCCINISDPEKPYEVSRFWLPEQWIQGGAKPNRLGISLHGPAHVEGNRAFLPYGQGGMVILDIEDKRFPKLISRTDFGTIFGSSLGVHTVLPIIERSIAIVNTEAIAENGNEPLNYAGIMDIKDEKNPRLISLFPIPEPPDGANYKNFIEKGGRFGPHNQHHYQNNPILLKRTDLVYLTYFNAGLRIYDIKDPYLPKEVGYFIPSDPSKRLGLLPNKLVVQTEDVIVDVRGYIYISNKNQGIYILQSDL